LKCFVLDFGALHFDIRRCLTSRLGSPASLPPDDIAA